MIYNESSILADIYSNLLNEDLQSSLNQAQNILKNNGISNYPDILSELENVYNQANQNPEYEKVNKDTNVPALAYWYLADSNIQRIRQDYLKYLSTPSLYRKNFLINSIESLKKEITTKKLFKPSNEKNDLIRRNIIKIVETIHSNYVQPKSETDSSEVLGDNNDNDVVYEDDEITVYRADSKAKCIQYGKGSSLCISTKGGGNYYWSYRMGLNGPGMTTYFVYWKDGSNRILVDALENSETTDEYSWNPIKSNIDSRISKEKLIKKYPELLEPFNREVFKFIPYSEKEKKLFYIDKHVYSVKDENLKTFEDFDMFFELDKPVNFKDFEYLEGVLSEREVAYLYKKYIWNGENYGSYLMSLKYLSPGDFKKVNQDIKKEPSYIQGEYYINGVVGNKAQLPALEKFAELYISSNENDKRFWYYYLDPIKKYLYDLFLDKSKEEPPKVLRLAVTNRVFHPRDEGDISVGFGENGYVNYITRYDGALEEFYNDDGNLIKDGIHGNYRYYDHSGRIIGEENPLSQNETEFTIDDEHYILNHLDDSKTYLDTNNNPTHIKYKDGSVDYYDDTDNYMSSKNSRFKKQNIKKESFDLSYLLNVIDRLH